MTDPRDEALRTCVEALAALIYETTHLSPRDDDGSHWCRITADALEAARDALATARAVLEAPTDLPSNP